MAQKRKINVSSNSKAKMLFLMIIISLLSTVTGTMVCSIMMSKEMIGEDCVGYCAIGILLISSTAVATTTNKIGNGNMMRTILAACAIYEGLLLAMTALFFGGRFRGICVSTVVVLSGGMLSILLRGKKKRVRQIR